MKKELTVSITAAVFGAFAAAVCGQITFVSPLKEDLEATRNEKVLLESRVNRYMYGAVKKTAISEELSFEVAHIEWTAQDTLLVKVLVSNRTDDVIQRFLVFKDKTSVQTDNLEVYKVSQASVLTTGMLKKSAIGMPLPPRAKHVPISLELSDINPDSKFLTAINLSYTLRGHVHYEQLVVFNDLSIPPKNST